MLVVFREEVGKLTFRLSEYEAKWREEEAKEFREEATNTMEEIYFPPIKRYISFSLPIAPLKTRAEQVSRTGTNIIQVYSS